MMEAIAFGTSILVFLTAIVGYAKLTRRTQEIHIMVNARLLAEQDWNDQLSLALQEAGLQVPPRPVRP